MKDRISTWITTNEVAFQALAVLALCLSLLALCLGLLVITGLVWVAI